MSVLCFKNCTSKALFDLHLKNSHYKSTKTVESYNSEVKLKGIKKKDKIQKYESLNYIFLLYSPLSNIRAVLKLDGPPKNSGYACSFFLKYRYIIDRTPT